MVSTTMASVTELDGNDNAPETFKLVVVTLLALIYVGFKLVAAKVPKKPLVEVTLVPVAVVKPKAPDKVPPVSNK